MKPCVAKWLLRRAQLDMEGAECELRVAEENVRSLQTAKDRLWAHELRQAKMVAERCKADVEELFAVVCALVSEGG